MGISCFCVFTIENKGCGYFIAWNKPFEIDMIQGMHEKKEGFEDESPMKKTLRMQSACAFSHESKLHEDPASNVTLW